MLMQTSYSDRKRETGKIILTEYGEWEGRWLWPGSALANKWLLVFDSIFTEMRRMAWMK